MTTDTVDMEREKNKLLTTVFRSLTVRETPNRGELILGMIPDDTT